MSQTKCRSSIRYCMVTNRANTKTTSINTVKFKPRQFGPDDPNGGLKKKQPPCDTREKWMRKIQQHVGYENYVHNIAASNVRMTKEMFGKFSLEIKHKKCVIAINPVLFNRLPRFSKIVSEISRF